MSIKTWEMIKELTENPGKKFVLKYDKSGSYVAVDGNVIVWRGANQKGQEMAVVIGEEWEEVKEPVDFMTAFNAFAYDGKTIYCAYESEIHYFYGNSSLDYSFGEGLIELGKWYIEN